MPSSVRMPISTKMQLEAEGYTVFEEYHARSGRTLTYVHHPENNVGDPVAGHTLKWFATLADIDHYVVDDGEYFDFDVYGWPVDYCPPGAGHQADNDLWHESGTLQYGPDGQVLFDPLTWGLIIMAILLASSLLILAIANFIRAINDPCGTTKWVDINECWKIITAPDCSKAEFNACGGPDANGDGKPDGQWAGAAPGESGSPNWTKDIFDPTQLIMWTVIGVVAIAAVFIVYKMIPQRQQPQYPQYYPPPQQYREAPGIDTIR